MTAVQNSYKSENQITADCVSLANTALEYFNITDWKVRQLNQIFKVNVLDPAVFVSIISHNQTGRQYITRTQTDEVITRTNYNKQEVTIRFSAIHRDLETDTTETYNSVDVLKLLKSYMQSLEGIETLKDLGYVQYRAGAVSTQSYTNDSDNFEILPYFDVTFLYTDEWTSEINKIDKVQLTDIYEV